MKGRAAMNVVAVRLRRRREARDIRQHFRKVIPLGGFFLSVSRGKIFLEKEGGKEQAQVFYVQVLSYMDIHDRCTCSYARRLASHVLGGEGNKQLFPTPTAAPTLAPSRCLSHV